MSRSGAVRRMLAANRSGNFVVATIYGLFRGQAPKSDFDQAPNGGL